MEGRKRGPPRVCLCGASCYVSSFAGALVSCDYAAAPLIIPQTQVIAFVHAAVGGEDGIGGESIDEVDWIHLHLQSIVHQSSRVFPSREGISLQ